MIIDNIYELIMDTCNLFLDNASSKCCNASIVLPNYCTDCGDECTVKKDEK